MDNNSIDKYIKRLEQLQNLYKKGEGQHNAFGIAINEAKEMLVSKNESLHDVMICRGCGSKDTYKCKITNVIVCKECGYQD